MKIRNIHSIKNVALVIAALTVTAPVAHAQNRVFNVNTGRYANLYNNSMVNGVNANSGLYSNNYYGFLNNYSPYVIEQDPYFYGTPYRENGAIILGADGRLYDTNAANGNGVAYPLVNQGNQSGMLNATPVQLSDQIEARRLSGNRVRIVWSGDPRPIAKMAFSLLDSKRTELRTTVVNDLPAEAIFTRPSTAVYYRVVITYGDGAMRSIVASL